MSNCEKYEELCSAALDHALTPEEKQELDAHLAICPSCRAYFEDLREMRALWKGLEVPVPKELHEKMMGAIEAEVQKTIVQTPQKHHRRPPVFTMLAAAAACVMLAVSGDLTGLFGQVSTMPLKPASKDPLPSTAEVQPPAPKSTEPQPFEQPVEQEKEPVQKPEQEPAQRIVPKETQKTPEQVTGKTQEEPQDAAHEKLEPEPPKAEHKQLLQEKPEQPQEPPADGAQVPMRIAEDEMAPGSMGRAAAPPPEAATTGVPTELSQMQFARCYDVTGGKELPILDDMTLLVSQDGVSYYSVENNESKIVQVQQELMKHGFEMTLNEVSGISIQRTAKTVLLIVHTEA